MRSNFLHITLEHQPVQGTWTIDPTLRIPESLLPHIKFKDGQRVDNLHLSSHHKAVEATLSLISDVPSKSYLYLKSEHAPVTVSIVSRVNQRFRLKAKSSHKKVTVRLPRDFEGPITFKHAPQFSAALLQRLTIIERDGKRGTAFVGDVSAFSSSRLSKDGKAYEGWDGDELSVSTDHGKILLGYADEA